VTPSDRIAAIAAAQKERHASRAPRAPKHPASTLGPVGVRGEITLPGEITTFGKAVRWARRARGWTMPELAFLVGCSPKVLQNIEYGHQGTRRIERFEQELGVKLGHLPVARVATSQAERENAAKGTEYRERKARRARETRHDESVHSLREKRKVLGLEGECREVLGVCRFCHGMSWRRHRDGCLGCGKPFEPEPAMRVDALPVSNAAFMGEAGDSAA
jgi:ribosome-binding protein aMBF1 (putative translation factor)